MLWGSIILNRFSSQPLPRHRKTLFPSVMRMNQTKFGYLAPHFYASYQQLLQKSRRMKPCQKICNLSQRLGSRTRPIIWRTCRSWPIGFENLCNSDLFACQLFFTLKAHNLPRLPTQIVYPRSSSYTCSYTQIWDTRLSSESEMRGNSMQNYVKSSR